MRRIAWTLIAGGLTAVASAADPVRLTPAAASATPMRVTATLEVGGDLLLGPDADPQPVRVDATAEYRQTPAEADACVRRYTAATLTVGGAERAALDAERGPVLARRAEGRVRCQAAGAAFTRPELDLAELPADPLTTAALLPADAVQQGHEWAIAAEALGPMLRLDSVSLCDVDAVLTDLSDTFARFRFAGAVHGRAAGAETQIDLRGVGLFDRTAGVVKKLNLGIEERREMGPATPGLDVTAKLSLSCEVDETNDRTPAHSPDQFASPGVVRIVSNDGRWETLAPRTWRTTGQTRTTIELKAVEGENAIATTLLRSIAAGEPRAEDLQAFEEEVRSSMGAGGRLISLDESTTPQGLRLFAITTRGEEEGVPTEWRHYLLTGPDAAVSVVTRLATHDAEGFAAGDRVLVDALTFAGDDATASGDGRLRR